jgi:hypothetical protein
VKAVCALSLVVVLSCAALGCGAPGGGGPIDVPLVPDIWAVTALLPPKAITVDPTVAVTAEFQASFAPVVTGFHSNATLSVGDTFSGAGPSGTSTITTTITSEDSGRDIVFTGEFSDQDHSQGRGHYTLKHHKKAGTFDFDQTVIYRWTADSVTTTMLVMTVMSGTVAADGSYTGAGTAWAYQHIYNAGTDTATAQWTAFTGKMLSRNGFYGVLCLQATGPDGYVACPDTPVVPEYTDISLMAALKALTVGYPYPYLAYHDSVGWAMVDVSQAAAIWTAHGGEL